MSLVFNDTLTYRGIVQEYEKECGYEFGDVSGDPIKLASFVSSANLAFDDFLALAFSSESTWQLDDSNYGDYPIISTDLIAGQRDYSFTGDQDGSLILEIYGVYVATPTGVFVKISPVDVETGMDTQQDRYAAAASGLLYYGGLSTFTDGQNTQGTPNRYDKLANGIFLDPIPNYNMRLVQEGKAGLKAYVNREASYFVTTDTAKKPGVPGLFHRYFVLRPAEDYARQNNKVNYGALHNERIAMELSIQTYFSRRARDERNRITAGRHNNR